MPVRRADAASRPGSRKREDPKSKKSSNTDESNRRSKSSKPQPTAENFYNKGLEALASMEPELACKFLERASNAYL